MTLESLKVKYWFVSYYTYHPEIELMVSSEKRDIWTQTLSAMKVSLESSYEFKTVVHEESKLIEGLKDDKKDFVVFSGYRRNAGRRRLNDTRRVIDTALVKIVCCDSKDAPLIYLETLKAVSIQTRWASVLEKLTEYDHTIL